MLACGSKSTSRTFFPALARPTPILMQENDLPRMVLPFNYKEGTKTITFAEIDEVFSSDLSLLSVPTEIDNHRLSFFVGLRNRARHTHERICVTYSFEDTTARSNPRQVLRPLLPVPNSRNPNLVPVGDGFGFLEIFTVT